MTPADIISAAKAQNVVIATAESCTGGMVSAALTDIAGSSAVFDRGFVTYSNAAKQDMLGVDRATLSAFGAVSIEVAVEMALGAIANSNAQMAVSVTGIAGPGGSEHKPEGRGCFAIAMQGQTASEIVEFGPIGRANVRAAAREHALSLIAIALKDNLPKA